MSIVLQKSNDTVTYFALYDQLAVEFHRVFYSTSTKVYADGLQAAQVLALASPDVVPSDIRCSIVNYLVSDITKNGKHVTIGIVSTAQIYPILSDNGHHDLALEMISSTTYPSRRKRK